MNRGQNLVLSDEVGKEQVVGGFRETKRGIDAYAQTFGYDPGRSQKGFPTIGDAKAFVESFRPWELHGVQNVTVDPVARPPLDSEPIGKPDPATQPTESAAPKQRPTRRWWKFWRRG